jgi:hypothetical protein
VWCSERQPVTNIGRWRWADRSLALNWLLYRVRSSSLRCAVSRCTSPLSSLRPSCHFIPLFLSFLFTWISLPTHRGTLFLRSTLQDPFRLSVPSGCGSSILLPLPSPQLHHKIPPLHIIRASLCSHFPSLLPIAPSASSSPPWRARECNFPYFERPARCSQTGHASSFG